MKLPTFRKINKNDYPTDYKDLMERLAYTINLDVEVLYEALNGNITLADNQRVTVSQFSMQAKADGTPNGTAPQIKLKFNTAVIGTHVISLVDPRNVNRYPTSGPFCSGVQDGEFFKVNHITGLESGITYNITIILYQA